jgi:apolipoprotein N-acyltransferase
MEPTVALAAMAVVYVHGVLRMEKVLAHQPLDTLRVAIVQPNPSLAEKRSDVPAVRLRYLDRAEMLTRALPPRSRDLIVWPEGTFPFHVQDPGADQYGPGSHAARATRRLEAMVAELGTDLVTGGLRKVKGHLYNTALLLRAGSPAQPLVYAKSLLVPMGERMPFSDWFPSLRGKIKGVSDMRPGGGPDMFTLARGIKAHISICYEASFPGFTRDGVREGADLIANLTNDQWFGDTGAPWLHVMVQTNRAVENRVPIVRAASTGVSAIIDATGRVVSSTALFEPAVLEADVPLRRVMSVYREFGEVFLWAAAAVSGLIVLLRTVRRGRAGM